MGLSLFGIMGGFIFRSNAKLMDLKNECDLTSLAPARAPKRFFSFLVSNFRIKDLQWLDRPGPR